MKVSLRFALPSVLETLNFTARIWPRYPSAISPWIVASTSRVPGAGTIWVIRWGLRREASSISWASPAFIAMRASHNTCLLASSAARVKVRCM